MNEILKYLWESHKNLWRYLDNIDYLGLIFAFIFASPLIFLCYFFIWTSITSTNITLLVISILIYLISIVVNFFLLFFKRLPYIRGNFGIIGRIVMIILSISTAPAIFLMYFIYFFGIGHIWMGDRIIRVNFTVNKILDIIFFKIFGNIILFIFNPVAYILWAIPFVLAFSRKIWGFIISFIFRTGSWHPAICSSCGKDMKIEVMVRHPLCHNCLVKIYE